jgi:hypothetical protein
MVRKEVEGAAREPALPLASPHSSPQRQIQYATLFYVKFARKIVRIKIRRRKVPSRINYSADEKYSEKNEDLASAESELNTVPSGTTFLAGRPRRAKAIRAVGRDLTSSGHGSSSLYRLRPWYKPP